jgi:hypothetical protein
MSKQAKDTSLHRLYISLAASASGEQCDCHTPSMPQVYALSHSALHRVTVHIGRSTDKSRPIYVRMSEKSVSTVESRVMHSAGTKAGVCVKL